MSEINHHTNWTSLREIANSGELSCIDGRHEHCIVSAPGGNMGEFILMLGAAESIGAMKFSAKQIEIILGEYANNFGQFYMHTDTHAISRLLISLTNQAKLSDWLSQFNESDNIEDFYAALLSPSKDLSEHILSYLIQPYFIGCGHLSLLVKYPKKYGIRKQLAQDSLRSFFHLMWNGNAKMHWELLKGEHNETEVVTLESKEDLNDNSVVPYSCNQAAGQRYVNHVAARRFFHKRDADFLNQIFLQIGIPKIELPLFIEKIERKATQQLNHTLEILAPDLPQKRLII